MQQLGASKETWPHLLTTRTLHAWAPGNVMDKRPAQKVSKSVRQDFSDNMGGSPVAGGIQKGESIDVSLDGSANIWNTCR